MVRQPAGLATARAKCKVRTSLRRFSRTSSRYCETKVSRVMSRKSSTSAACVQYESWTVAMVRPWCCETAAGSSTVSSLSEPRRRSLRKKSRTSQLMAVRKRWAASSLTEQEANGAGQQAALEREGRLDAANRGDGRVDIVWRKGVQLLPHHDRGRVVWVLDRDSTGQAHHLPSVSDRSVSLAASKGAPHRQGVTHRFRGKGANVLDDGEAERRRP